MSLKRIVLLGLAVLFVSVPVYAQTKSVTIGLSLPSEEGAFFDALVRNIQFLAEEAGIELVVTGAGYDLETENANIQSLIQQQIDVLLLTPTDAVGSAAAVQSANAAGIPVILLGGELETADLESQPELAGTIVADYAAEGQLAAETMCGRLEGRGVLLEAINVPTDETADLMPLAVKQASERSAGFATAFGELCPDVEIVPLNVAGLEEADVTDALLAAINAQPFNGLLAYDDQTVLAALDVFQQSRTRGVAVMGFGASEILVGALELGDIEATITLKPDQLAKAGLDAALAYLQGTTVSAEVESVALNVEELTVMRSCGGAGQPRC
jgi:ABC-type sugar transport system substrate-binding protein